MNRIVVLTTATVAVLLAGPVSARIDRWSADRGEDTVAVTDCSDCGDDVGVLVACRRPGAVAKLSVPFLALEAQSDPADDPVSLAFRIDGETFRLPAAFEQWSMVGAVPVVALPRSSRLALAIRRGHLMEIELAARTIQIGLKGSAAAMAIFDVYCDWGDDDGRAVDKPG